MGRIKWLLGGLLVVVLVVGLGALVVGIRSHFVASWRSEEVAIRKIEALRRGDQSVRLESVEFECCEPIAIQKWQPLFTDPESLRYLEECFQRNEPMPLGGMVTYKLRLRFEGGGTVEALSYWFDGGFGLYLPGEAAGDGAGPWVTVWFKHPMPKSVDVIIASMGVPPKPSRALTALRFPAE
jgi:hypothetical protein